MTSTSRLSNCISKWLIYVCTACAGYLDSFEPLSSSAGDLHPAGADGWLEDADEVRSRGPSSSQVQQNGAGGHDRHAGNGGSSGHRCGGVGDSPYEPAAYAAMFAPYAAGPPAVPLGYGGSGWGSYGQYGAAVGEPPPNGVVTGTPLADFAHQWQAAHSQQSSALMWWWQMWMSTVYAGGGGAGSDAAAAAHVAYPVRLAFVAFA